MNKHAMSLENETTSMEVPLEKTGDKENQQDEAQLVIPKGVQLAKRPKLGFVGVGWIGWHRMKAVVDSCSADVCTVLEPAGALATKVRELAPEAHFCANLREMLDSDVDGVVIATPSGMHAEQAKAALESGIAVFCQKPLGRNLPETKLVVEAGAKSDRLLDVDLCYRRLRCATKLYDLIHSGALGKIFHVDLTFHNAYGPDKAWFYDPSLSGGGCVMDLGIHLVDLALWLLDFPHAETVQSQLFTGGHKFGGRENEVEDFASASIGFVTGATAQLSCSWNLHAGQDAVIEVAVHGTKGAAALRNLNGSFYDFFAEHFVGTKRFPLCAPPDDWGGRAIIAWVERLAQPGGERFDPAAEHFCEDAEIIDRIYDS